MSAQRMLRRAPRAVRQRGQAMLLTVLLVGIGASAVIYSFVAPAKRAIERDRITAAALAEAKAALIGYAVGIRVDTGISPRVGDLPCPDMNPPGDVNEGAAGASCSNAGGTTLGRLPWKTLGLPDLRDGYGERLWYAVSANFKNNPAVGVLNSDARGTITVWDRGGNKVNDGTNPDPYTPSGVVAVIMAPGAVLQRADGTLQGRGTAAAQVSPVNYLDIANVGGNEDNANFVDSNPNGFINGDVLDGNGNVIVNDRLIAIRYEDLMPLVERRVAKEAFNCATSYAAANNGRYPWAAQVASGTYSDLNSPPVRFGRIPDPPMSQSVLGTIPASLTVNFGIPIPIGAILQGLCTATPALCMGSAWPASPACNFASGTWWANWKEQVFYGVASAYSPSLSISVNLFVPPYVTLFGIAGLGGCGSCLTVNPPSAAADKQIVIIVAGKSLANPPLIFPAAPGEQRSSAAQTQDAANYLEDANIAAPADSYTKLPRSTLFNDTVLYK